MIYPKPLGTPMSGRYPDVEMPGGFVMPAHHRRKTVTPFEHCRPEDGSHG